LSSPLTHAFYGSEFRPLVTAEVLFNPVVPSSSTFDSSSSFFSNFGTNMFTLTYDTPTVPSVTHYAINVSLGTQTPSGALFDFLTVDRPKEYTYNPLFSSNLYPLNHTIEQIQFTRTATLNSFSADVLKKSLLWCV